MTKTIRRPINSVGKVYPVYENGGMPSLTVMLLSLVLGAVAIAELVRSTV